MVLIVLIFVTAGLYIMLPKRCRPRVWL